MKKKVLSKFLIILGLSLLIVGLVGCGSGDVDVDDGSPNPKKYTQEPQEKTSEGYYVYYAKGIEFYKDTLIVDVINGGYANVPNIGESLTIVVSEEYSGTVLIMKHWQSDGGVDDAELVVRTQDQKDIWEKAISEYLEEWEKSEQLRLSPRDVLPPGFVMPKPPVSTTLRSYLGILYDPDYSTAITFNYDGVVLGVRIKKVIEGTPPDRFGLKEGDIIVAVDGESLTSWSQVDKLLPRHSPEDKVSLTVVRDGGVMLLTIFLSLPPKK